LEGLLASLDSEFRDLEDRLKFEYPKVKFDTQRITNIRDLLRIETSPSNPLEVFLQSTGKKNGRGETTINLSFRNLQAIPVRILGVRAVDSSGKTLAVSDKTTPWIYWNGTVRDRNPITATFPWQAPLSDADSLRVRFQLMGSDAVMEKQPYEWTNTLPQDLADPRHHSNWSEIRKYATVDQKRKVIIIQGKTLFSEALAFPPGYEVKIQPGSQLLLGKGVTLVSYSPVIALGLADQPIKFGSIAEKSGSGLLVINSGKSSVFQHVDFSDMSKAESEPLKGINAIVTFYKSPQSWKNCSFFSIQSASALELVDSDFMMENVSFNQMENKAISIKGAKGSVSNLQLFDVGTDGIFLDHGQLAIDGFSATRMGSHGINASHLSRVTLAQGNISKANVGILASGGSKVTATNFRISDSQVALQAFKNRTDTGGSRVIAISGVLERNGREYLKDSFSSLSYNRREQAPNR